MYEKEGVEYMNLYNRVKLVITIRFCKRKVRIIQRLSPN